MSYVTTWISNASKYTSDTQTQRDINGVLTLEIATLSESLVMPLTTIF